MAALFCNFVIWNQEQGQSRRSKRRANQAYLHENWCAANIPPYDHFGSFSRWEREAPVLSGCSAKLPGMQLGSNLRFGTIGLINRGRLR